MNYHFATKGNRTTYHNVSLQFKDILQAAFLYLVIINFQPFLLVYGVANVADIVTEEKW
jgi:hypothetical protein